MGCDIHIIAEIKKRDGEWEENMDEIFPDYDYDKKEKVLSKTPESHRNYDWFAVLADVRNGRWFAGAKTGEGFAVIAEPRGVPKDASQEWKEKVEMLDGDDHSHSWLTVDDFDRFDWNQVSMKTGCIRLEEYRQVKETNGVPPNGWCGGISGGNVTTISMENADREIENPGRYGTMDIYVQYYWPVIYSEWFADKIKDIVEPLRELSKKYEAARICFCFDN
jgi:hypothetical protein